MDKDDEERVQEAIERQIERALASKKDVSQSVLVSHSQDTSHMQCTHYMHLHCTCTGLISPCYARMHTHVYLDDVDYSSS